TAISTTVALTISAPVAPSFTTQPANTTVVAGATASFTAVATGVPTPVILWYKNGDFATVVGSGGTLSLPNVQVADSTSTYTAVATSTISPGVTLTANSSTAVLIVTPVPPSITTQPASQSVTPGSDVTLSVIASGSTPFTYQWRKNGNPIAGAT